MWGVNPGWPRVYASCDVGSGQSPGPVWLHCGRGACVGCPPLVELKKWRVIVYIMYSEKIKESTLPQSYGPVWPHCGRDPYGGYPPLVELNYKRYLCNYVLKKINWDPSATIIWPCVATLWVGRICGLPSSSRTEKIRGYCVHFVLRKNKLRWGQFLEQ
jgi:hypothetical protein